MRTRCRFSMLFAAAVLLTVRTGASQEKVLEPPETSVQAPTEAEINTLIKDLDANRFSKRQAAGQKLRQLGKTAIAALAEAAVGDSREASSRSIEILKEHFTKGDPEIKEATKKALEKLAASDKAPIARKANDILNPQPPRQPTRAMQFGGGQIQIQFQAAGGGQQVKVKTINGVKEIDVKENGRQIKIHDDPNKGIKVEITEKIDGKEKTRKFEAKNADELKKKHPEAHKLYEKYKRGGGFQIQVGQQGRIPLRINPPFFQPAAQPLDRRQIAQELKKIVQQLDDTRDLLKDLSTEDSQSLQKALEQLEKAKKGLEDTQAKLEK